MEPLEDITKGLKSDLNAVEKDLKSIGKTKPQEKKTADPAEKADPAPDAAEKTEAASVSKETNESAEAAAEVQPAAEEEGESV